MRRPRSIVGGTYDAAVPGTARYDEFAEWYIEETSGWGSETLSPLPASVDGQRVLELACGPGRLARGMARAGAHVTAVDLSEPLLAHGRSQEREQPLGIEYVHGDVATTNWWDGSAFDGAVCDMALMDIDDLDGTLTTIATVLVDGGWFAFAIVHPCHPGGPGTASGLPSWPPDGGYDQEGWWTNDGDIGIRARVGANHRKLSTYLNRLIGAGFVFEEFSEPAFDVPLFFAARCRISRA